MRTPSRDGSALVIAAMMVVVLGGLAISLTQTTVSGLKGEQRRSDDLALAMAAESSANIALDYLQRNTALLKTDLSAAQKATELPTKADVEAAKDSTDISGASKMGVTRVHGMPVGARWCYIGQRAVVKTYVDGLPRLQVVPIGTANSMTQDVYYIRAWATQGSASDVASWRTRRVEMLFVPYPQEVFVRAMFAHNGYDFQGSATTDSWDSDPDKDGVHDVKYDPAAHNMNGTLGSEGDIYVQKPENVGGEKNIQDFINFPLPPVEFDGSLPVQPAKILSGNVTLPSGSYRYEAVNLQEPDQLTLTGAVTLYVDGPVAISGGKKFNPIVYSTSSARLTIIQNDYDPAAHPEWNGISNSIDTVNGNEAIGDVNDPTRLVYISAYDGELTFNGNGKFGGVLYMPNATMKMNGTFDFYGSVIADTFASKDLTGADLQGKVNGTFSFHYDESLARLKLPLPARIGVVGWYTTNPVVGGP